MPRELFTSERRYIENVLSKRAAVRVGIERSVVAEYYAPPRSHTHVRFNTDYILQLVRDDQRKQIKGMSYCASILPNTLGVEVFVTVDERTFQPILTELLGGEALSLEYYDDHIERIESRLAELAHPIKLRQASYCRIFVIESDICFLAFPNDQSPLLRGNRKVLCDDEESSIACSVDPAGIVYVDGWIRTAVAETERKLEFVSI